MLILVLDTILLPAISLANGNTCNYQLLAAYRWATWEYIRSTRAGPEPSCVHLQALTASSLWDETQGYGGS